MIRTICGCQETSHATSGGEGTHANAKTGSFQMALWDSETRRWGEDNKRKPAGMRLPARGQLDLSKKVLFPHVQLNTCLKKATKPPRMQMTHGGDNTQKDKQGEGLTINPGKGRKMLKVGPDLA